ncbi:hypothetical protein ACHAXR_007753 [Thalassiosira sp. AJA248-18]
MLSANDALFTLHSSAATSSRGVNNWGGNASSAVTGVCFVRDPIHSHDLGAAPNGGSGIKRINGPCQSDDNDGSSNDDCNDDDTSELQFRCSNLLLGPQPPCDPEATLNIINANESRTHGVVQSYQHATHLSAASHHSLLGSVLASCHLDGSCKLWDLATRRCIVKDIGLDNPRGGSGLAVRRLDVGRGEQSHQFLYQTRDPFGTISLHDLHRPCTPLLQMRTFSTTFCAMSPCNIGSETLGGATMGGEANLVALPTEEHSVAVVRDLRCHPRGNPAWRVTVGDDYISTMYGSRRKYGMLTSLALCLQESTQKIVLGCGMENGSVLFYDLGAMGKGRDPWRIEPGDEAVQESNLHGTGSHCAGPSSGVISEVDSRYMCSATLGKDPVLSLDLVSTDSREQLKKDGNRASLVALGSCAGDADELSELPEQDQGTISTMKVKLADDYSVNGSNMKAIIRSKTRTCSINSGGKVGVSIGRFRPDGRIYAVGGWDHRLRLFGRTSSKPLAILRGHENSVTAMDWASNAALSGLLATGAGDGRICIWRAFPHSLKSCEISAKKKEPMASNAL